MASKQDDSQPRRARCADRRAERHHRSLQADVRPDGAGVPGRHHARDHVLDGPRSEHADLHQPGIAEAFHPLSHHGNSPEARWRSWFRSSATTPRCSPSSSSGCRRRRRRAARCSTTPTILYGSNMSNSDKHNNDPLPSALLGHANGKIKGGQHINYPQDSRFADLLVTTLRPEQHPGREDRRQRRHSLGGLECVGSQPSSSPRPPRSTLATAAEPTLLEAVERGDRAARRGDAGQGGEPEHPWPRRHHRADVGRRQRRRRAGASADQGRRRRQGQEPLRHARRSPRPRSSARRRSSTSCSRPAPTPTSRTPRARRR